MLLVTNLVVCICIHDYRDGAPRKVFHVLVIQNKMFLYTHFRTRILFSYYYVFWQGNSFDHEILFKLMGYTYLTYNINSEIGSYIIKCIHWLHTFIHVVLKIIWVSQTFPLTHVDKGVWTYICWRLLKNTYV
jgi:hypothetical protein